MCFQRAPEQRASATAVLEELGRLGGKECVSCGDRFPLAGGVLCSGAERQHLLCHACLAAYVLAQPGLVGCALVPSGDCDDEELSQGAVLAALMPHAHAHARYLNAIRRAAVEDFRREELERCAHFT
eukprot:3539836-Rhodomonas_salina.1